MIQLSMGAAHVTHINNIYTVYSSRGWSCDSTLYGSGTQHFSHTSIVQVVLTIQPSAGVTPHSNHVTSSKRVDTLICHTTTHINFLYNPGHVTL